MKVCIFDTDKNIILFMPTRRGIIELNYLQGNTQTVGIVGGTSAKKLFQKIFIKSTKIS